MATKDCTSEAFPEPLLKKPKIGAEAEDEDEHSIMDDEEDSIIDDSSSDEETDPIENPRVRSIMAKYGTKLNNDFVDDEKDYCPEGVTKMDHELWDKYIKQCNESEGFDIQDFPGDCLMAALVPCTDLFVYPPLQKAVEECATLAIGQYKGKNGEEYRFEKVEKANALGVSGFIYYITFQASNPKGELETFQAEVYDGISQRRVRLIRPKVSAKLE